MVWFYPFSPYSSTSNKNLYRRMNMIIKSPILFPPHRPARKAFTLVELLLVLVVLGTLAAIVLPKFSGTSERARKTQAQTQFPPSRRRWICLRRTTVTIPKAKAA